MREAISESFPEPNRRLLQRYIVSSYLVAYDSLQMNFFVINCVCSSCKDPDDDAGSGL